MRRAFDQVVRVRPPGQAGEEAQYDYAQAYATAGATFGGDTIRYSPAGEIAPQIVHGDYAYMGLVLPKPEGATSVDVEVSGSDEVEHLDLTQDGEFVSDGEPIEYFSFATKGGGRLPMKTWRIYLTWHGAATVRTYCEIYRR